MQLYVPSEEPSQSSRGQRTKTQKVRNIPSHRIWIGILSALHDCSQQQDQVWLCSPCLQETCWSSSSITCNSFLPANATTCLTLWHEDLYIFIATGCRDRLDPTLAHFIWCWLLQLLETLFLAFSTSFINCHQASDSPFLPLKIGKNVNLPQLII